MGDISREGREEAGVGEEGGMGRKGDVRIELSATRKRRGQRMGVVWCWEVGQSGEEGHDLWVVASRDL